MCAIAGIAALDGKALPPREAVERMLGVLAPRGPDDAGLVVEPGVALGHRRLSIVDLTPAAHQPMRHAAGYLLTYNGEIYNHAEVRAALGAGDYPSTGDTATLLAALARDGEQALKSLNGMFAFGFWNRKDRSLLLVRDRLGVKPLYYARTKNWLIFASELRAILASGLVAYEPDAQGVADYLRYRYVPAPLTAAKGIFKLPAGHLLRVKRGRVTSEAWWQLTVAAADDPAPAQAQEVFEAILNDAVRRRLMADVPVGVFLSGGLDSSAVAAIVAEERTVDTFSVAFEGGGFYDERFYARQVARRLGTRHHETVVSDAQFARALPEVLGKLDEPIMDLAALPLYFLAELARSEVKVALSGEGADEVLGGYNLNRIAFELKALAAYQRIPRGLRDAARSFLGARMRAWLTPLSWPAGRYPALRGLHITRVFDAAQSRRLLGEWGRETLNPGRHLEAAYGRVAHADPLNQIQAVYTGAWLAEDLLMKADKMSMAHGLEVRVPFLDYRLVEFLFSLPGPMKVSGPATTGTKRMLRRAMRGRLPAAVLSRDKRGFPVPLAAWVRSRPRYFEEILGGGGLPGRLDRRAMTELLQSARRGAHVWPQVWNLTALALWDARMRGAASAARPEREAA
jgi:asparagine synthase (glutamine-hydrolysing)